MALYHLWLPYQWDWPDKLQAVSPSISWGMFSINFFFSILLMLGGLLTLFCAWRGREIQLMAILPVLGMGIFWVINAVYQVAIQFPLPENLSFLRWALLAFAVIMALLYLLPVLVALKARRSDSAASNIGPTR
jgi:hypothetical protein